MMSWAELHELADIIGAPNDGPIETATPMRFANVIRLNPETGKREAVRMRWGVPKAGSGTAMGPGHIHARSETADTLKAFRDSFEYRRGILVVNTFNEGRELPNGKAEQHIITPRDTKPVAIAILWERWAERNEGALLCFVMMTVAANRLIGTITDRMPAVIQPDQWAKWLGEIPTTTDELKAMLVPFEGDWDMQAATKSKPPPPKKPGPQTELF